MLTTSIPSSVTVNFLRAGRESNYLKASNAIFFFSGLWLSGKTYFDPVNTLRSLFLRSITYLSEFACYSILFIVFLICLRSILGTTIIFAETLLILMILPISPRYSPFLILIICCSWNSVLILVDISNSFE